jgi:hypothetical protein
MPAPANDLCSNATVIASLPFSDTIDTTAATVSGDDPSNSDFGGVPSNSAWYAWTAPSTDPVVLDTTGSDYDTVLAVYTGSCGGPFTEIASNDDNPDGGVQSWLTFTPVSGTTYRIVAASFALGGGSLTFNMGPVPPAPDPPTGLTATAVPLNIGVDLAWTAATGGTTPDAYSIERCSGSACSGFVEIDTVPVGTATYRDTPLTPSTLYRYRIIATLDNLSLASTPSSAADVTTTTPNYSAGLRNAFTAGWWNRGSSSTLAIAPYPTLFAVDAGTNRILDVQINNISSTFTGATLTAASFDVRLRYWNGSAFVSTVVSNPFSDPGLGFGTLTSARTSWIAHVWAVRVRCSTYDSVTATYAADGLLDLLIDNSAIISLSGITIARFNASHAIRFNVGCGNDVDRIWAAAGTTLPTVNSDGVPTGVMLAFLEDFNGGTMSPAWDSSGFSGAAPAILSDAGAAGGYGVSSFGAGPAGAPGAYSAYVGLTRTVTLAPAPPPRPAPIATTAAPTIDCAPQAQVGNGGKGKAGCNTGGTGWPEPKQCC